MTGRVLEADWLNTPETRAVMQALQTARPDCARFVGGCVRNTLMGQPVDDIDIATQLKPDETLKALEAAGIRAEPTGIEHGTVTAIVDHIPFEITSLRRDVETDGRRAVVAFTEDWAEDAQRRDFRFNAIYADRDGRLYDPTGGGLDDAAAGRVIFIGDPDQRLREDYLRILRFFRFNAWYARKVDEDGLAACARQKEGLKQIAAERIWKELKKMLGAAEIWLVVQRMNSSGILQSVLPALRSDPHLAQLQGMEAGDAFMRPYLADPMLRLMCLVPRQAEAIEKTATGLKLSNVERNRLEAWVKAPEIDFATLSRASLKRYLYTSGKRAFGDCFVSDLATDPDKFPSIARFISEILDGWNLPVFPLGGEDLLKAGMSPGPEMGKWLKTIEDWWIDGDFSAGKPELLEELERRLKAD